MGADLIVLPTPALDQHLRFQQGCKDLSVDEFISQLPVEGLNISILPGTSRFNEKGRYSKPAQPATYRLGRELRPVVRSDVFWNTSEDKQIKQLVNDIL